MSKPLNENIQHVRIENEQGDLLPIMDAAGAKFSELVNAVTANNKAGTLTLKIAVKPSTAGALAVKAEVSIAKPMRNLMDLLASGEAYEIGGQVVMRMPEIDKVFAERAEWVEVAPAVEGWIDCWQRLAPDLPSYNLGVMAKLLREDKPLTVRLIEQARAEFDDHVARLVEILDDQIRSAITTTQLAWEFEKISMEKAA